MEHVEEAGHPLGRLVVRAARRRPTTRACATLVRRLGPALGVVGLLNVQLAIADGEVYVLEVNPRASRTVPFASKATGVNLVDAACRLAAGATLADLGLPPEALAATGYHVKAAVLPFARFPGADPVLGPEMRSTGEVMASAADFADRVREGRARRRAARCRPADARSSPCATATRSPSCRSRARSPGSASSSSRPPARRSALAAAGIAGDAASRRATPVVDLVRRRGVDLVVNTPEGRNARTRRLRDPRGGGRRARAVHHDARRSRAPRSRRSRRRAPSRRGRSRSGMPRREPRSVVAVEAIGPYALAARRRAARSSPGIPGQFFMLEAPGRVLPRPMSLCLAPRGELAFLIDPIGPGTRALAALEPGDEIAVFGPLGNGFRLDVPRPLLVGGGIGIAPLPYLSEALERPPAVLGFRSEHHAEAAALVPNAEVVIDPVLVTDALPRGPRRARLRPRADARGGARARAGRAARVGGADGLRLRRLLRLRGRDRRRAASGSASKGRCCAPPERERLPRRADRARRRRGRSTRS